MSPLSLPSLLFVSALLLLPVAKAATYVHFPSTDISTRWAQGYNGFSIAPSASRATEALCAASVDSLTNGVGYLWKASVCYRYTSYPTLCSGPQTGIDGGFTQGMIDRCSTKAGYKMASDGSCIYTGGAELTTATYNNACPAGKANAAIPSPAYKKRVIVEQDAYAFVGGKVCPVGEMACSVWRKGWSCLDVSENLSSCGGCLEGDGVDCSELSGAEDVACVAGRCKINSCAQGWALSTLTAHCIRR